MDTAIVIYYIEQHPTYAPALKWLFEQIDTGQMRAVCSPVTLAECLVVPLRRNDLDAYRDFLDVILHARNTLLVPIDAGTSQQAAEIRARYNLALTDAFQVAVAVAADCDAFLTNDKGLKRIREVSVLVLDDWCESEATDR
ncbi:MAG: PIN domain-containing protein [Armatimonadota bacterium]